jgi:hypothetical protein
MSPSKVPDAAWALLVVGAVYGMVCLECEPVIRAGGQPTENVIEFDECLPRLTPGGLGYPVQHQLFQVGDPLTLPDLVGDADEQVVDVDVGPLPAGVRAGEPCEVVSRVR